MTRMMTRMSPSDMTPSFRSRFPCGRRPTTGDGAGLREPAWVAFYARHGRGHIPKGMRSARPRPRQLEDILAAPIELRLSKIAQFSSLRPRTNRGTIWVVYRCLFELLERILS